MLEDVVIVDLFSAQADCQYYYTKKIDKEYIQMWNTINSYQYICMDRVWYELLMKEKIPVQTSGKNWLYIISFKEY